MKKKISGDAIELGIILAVLIGAAIFAIRAVKIQDNMAFAYCKLDDTHALVTVRNDGGLFLTTYKDGTTLVSRNPNIDWDTCEVKE